MNHTTTNVREDEHIRMSDHYNEEGGYYRLRINRQYKHAEDNLHTHPEDEMFKVYPSSTRLETITCTHIQKMSAPGENILNRVIRRF